MRARPDRKPMRFIVLISQLGICMLTSVFICVFLGYYLSNALGKDWIFPLVLVIGIMAGFRSCYFMISKFVNLKEKTNEDPVIQKMKEKDL